MEITQITIGKRFRIDVSTRFEHPCNGIFGTGSRSCAAKEAICRLIDYQMEIEREARECNRVMAELKEIADDT